MSTFVKEEQDPTWRQLLEEGADCLLEAGISEFQLEAWYLLEASFSIDRIHFLMDRNRQVNRQRLEKSYPLYREYLNKRASRIPIQHILGNQEFMGLEFEVNENVLIPRQDTEKLVETVLKDHKDRNKSILDMCTGSGCIAVSLAVLGCYEKVTAADISRAALKVAKKNARRHFLVQKGSVRSESVLLSDEPWRLRMSTYVYPSAPEAQRRELILMESDLFANFSQEEQFDIIVSNPPYIPSSVIGSLEPEVRDHEPRLALDGTEDGLHFYRLLTQQSGAFLKKGGCLYFEIGYDQAASVGELLASAGFEEIEVLKDEPGLDRVVRARWNR